jgi:hypothetical protein
MSAERSPIDDAVRSLLDADLLEELDHHQQQYERDLAEADAAHARAQEWIRSSCLGRPFEHLEAELERERADLLAYHRKRFVGRVKAILEDSAVRVAFDQLPPGGHGQDT